MRHPVPCDKEGLRWRYIFDTMESRWRDYANGTYKLLGKSAIPEGHYQKEMSYSPAFRQMLSLLKDVPPARVFTIEVPDDRSKGAEGSDSGFYNSQVTSVGVVPSADGHVFHPSPPSNDSDNVGKSVTDGRTFDSSQNNISPHSADIPSSRVEADGSQKDNASRTQSQTRLSYAETQLILSNGGKRKDEPSAQQEGQSLNPNSTSSDGNGDYSQMSNGYSNPNGFHSNE